MWRLTRRMERSGQPGPDPGGRDERDAAAESLTLTFEQRRRSRFRARLDSGAEVAVVLPRGTALSAGDLLAGDDDGWAVVRVHAAAEMVSTAHAVGAALARAAYHLGNRHVPVELGDGWLRYPHDHVLDDMVRQLGLVVTIEEVPLEPEMGAYAGGHHHGHPHGEDHGHPHGEDHGHPHGEDHGYPHGEDHGHPHDHDHERR